MIDQRLNGRLIIGNEGAGHEVGHLLAIASGVVSSRAAGAATTAASTTPAAGGDGRAATAATAGGQYC